MLCAQKNGILSSSARHAKKSKIPSTRTGGVCPPNTTAVVISNSLRCARPSLSKEGQFFTHVFAQKRVFRFNLSALTAHVRLKFGFEATLSHSFGELKLILSKFGCTQHSANKFASAFVCTNFPVVASNAPSRCPSMSKEGQLFYAYVRPKTRFQL